MPLGTIPQNPAEWTLDHARSAPATLFPGGTFDAVAAEATAAYLRGDHLQEGRAWIGAGFDSSGTWIPSSYARFKRTLTPVPEMFAILRRRVNGACGNEPDASIAAKEPAGPKGEDGKKTSSPEQLTAQDEWKRDVGTNWWTRAGVAGGKNLRNPTGIRGVVAQASSYESGRACFRVYINPASRTLEVREGETLIRRDVPKQPTRAAALNHINLSTPPPDRCCVYTDPDTQQKTGVFLYRDFADNECAEVWFGKDAPSPRVTTARRVTVLRSLVANAEPKPDTVYPWGGLIPIVEADIGCILTDAVRRLQQAADLGGTSTTRNTQAHGYGQRTEIGAARDGKWSTIAPSLPNGEIPEQRVNEATQTVEYFWPEPAEMSPDVIRHLSPVEWLSRIDADGAKTYSATSPSVSFQQPSDPENTIKGTDAFLVWMRAACHQAHIKTGLAQGSTAEASGEAYEQARADFLQDITAVSETVDAAVAELLAVVTVMAEYLTGAPDPAAFTDEFSVSVQGHPSAGPPSTEFQSQTRENQKAGLLSTPEAVARLGIQDVGGEMARIAEDNAVSMIVQRWAAVASAVASGADAAAFLEEELGYSKERVARLLRSDSTVNVNQ